MNFTRAILAALLVFGLSMLALQAQSLRFDAGVHAKPFNMNSTQTEAAIQVQGNEVFQKFALLTGFGLKMSLESGSTSTTEIITKSFGLEIRYYPFADAADGYGCEQMRLGRRQPKLSARALKGFYAAAGFQRSNMQIDIMPDPALESPVDYFRAVVRENGLTLFAGYHARLPLLSLGAGYGVSISLPNIHDPWGVVIQDEIYSAVYPFRYRIDHGLRLFAGVNF